MTYALAIHGGAGTILKSKITPKLERAYHAGLGPALEAGEAVLRNGGPALEAVTAAVGALEEEPLFNAGRGAVVTDDGKQEMDAAIMEGTTRRAGTVAGIFGPRNRAQDYPRRRMVGAILALRETLRIRPGWSARGLRLAFVVFLLITSARMFLDLAASLTT